MCHFVKIIHFNLQYYSSPCHTSPSAWKKKKQHHNPLKCLCHIPCLVLCVSSQSFHTRRLGTMSASENPTSPWVRKQGVIMLQVSIRQLQLHWRQRQLALRAFLQHSGKWWRRKESKLTKLQQTSLPSKSINARITTHWSRRKEPSRPRFCTQMVEEQQT